MSGTGSGVRDTEMKRGEARGIGREKKIRDPRNMVPVTQDRKTQIGEKLYFGLESIYPLYCKHLWQHYAWKMRMPASILCLTWAMTESERLGLGEQRNLNSQRKHPL